MGCELLAAAAAAAVAVAGPPAGATAIFYILSIFISLDPPRLLSPFAQGQVLLALTRLFLFLIVLEVLAARRQAKQKLGKTHPIPPGVPLTAKELRHLMGGALRMKRRALELLLVRCLELRRAQQGTASPP
jgi:hypothetical protein